MLELATTTSDVITEAEAEAKAKVEGSRDPDLAEVRAAQGGDLAAAGQLYRRHQRRVTHLAYLMVGSHRDAEDICQDTFVHALRALGRFRGDSAFTTWLSRIAINECRDFCARQRRRERLRPLDLGGEQPLSERPIGELRLGLVRALWGLSQGQREVLVCHDLLGMKHDEIAVALGCAVGTSKAQLHKARLRVRNLLRGSEAGGD